MQSSHYLYRSRTESEVVTNDDILQGVYDKSNTVSNSHGDIPSKLHGKNKNKHCYNSVLERMRCNIACLANGENESPVGIRGRNPSNCSFLSSKRDIASGFRGSLIFLVL
jgi:hypothetical protein